MGLLLGLAFTVIHVLLAIPLGRTVDRSNRRNLILICGLLWSMCSIAAGFSRSYEWLFLSRVGIGAAEAGLYTAAVSLAAAYFSRKHLPPALRLVRMGPFKGGGRVLILWRLGSGAPGEDGHLLWRVMSAPLHGAKPGETCG